MLQLVTFFLGPVGRYVGIGILILGVLGYARESGRRAAAAACTIKLQSLDGQWRRQIEEANKEASDRVKAALAEADRISPTPELPADIVRLCRAEPAGCRDRPD